MGIATSVLDAARNEAAKRLGSRVLKVGLRIGEWSGVDPESLRFCFEVLANGDGAPPPELEIEFLKRQNRCPICGNVFALESFQIECPRCGGAVTEPVSGDELELAFVELEEP
ncbi:MAG TPA: hydrogenase maturation nickel metallochaperone HypA [Bryobacteraceae bacterium]|nr:hydrogenase maturation nickel metallochaperone HypA [Bryobacteraceae bacterium]